MRGDVGTGGAARARDGDASGRRFDRARGADCSAKTGDWRSGSVVSSGHRASSSSCQRHVSSWRRRREHTSPRIAHDCDLVRGGRQYNRSVIRKLGRTSVAGATALYSPRAETRGPNRLARSAFASAAWRSHRIQRPGPAMTLGLALVLRPPFTASQRRIRAARAIALDSDVAARASPASLHQ